MLTRREKVRELLEDVEHPITVPEICAELDILDRAAVYEDIEHIALSVKNDGLQVIVRAAECGKCRFVFSGRKTAKKPSKCPKCKSEWILDPGFIIIEQ